MSKTTCDGTGWVFWDPDSGEEYAFNHPVKSGEVPEAERIRRSTPQEDTLWQAFQDASDRAHQLSTAPTVTQEQAVVDREQIADIIAAKVSGPVLKSETWKRAHRLDQLEAADAIIAALAKLNPEVQS